MSATLEKKDTKFRRGQIPHNKGNHSPTGRINAKDITGKKFNRWTAVRRTSKKNGYWSWLFKCTCGTEKELSVIYVTQGLSKSCGCLKLEKLKIGHKQTDATRQKLSDSHKGSRNPQWRGGVTPEMLRLRNSIEMKLWKKSCLERDDYTCQKTGIRGEKLAVHHIENFSEVPELRSSIANGITLGFEVHKEFHRIYGIKNNTREQLAEFIGKQIIT